MLCSYSGADIGVVCREALLRPIRRLGSATHFKQVSTSALKLFGGLTNMMQVPNPKRDGPSMLWLTCSPGEYGAQPRTLDEIASAELCEPPVTMVSIDANL